MVLVFKPLRNAFTCETPPKLFTTSIAVRILSAVEVILCCVRNFPDFSIDCARSRGSQAARRVYALNESDCTEDTGPIGAEFRQQQPLNRRGIGSAACPKHAATFH